MTVSVGKAPEQQLDASMLGFRRIDFVRLFVGNGTVEAAVVGLVYHAPRELPISLRIASRLIRQGVPVFTHSFDSSEQSRDSIGHDGSRGPGTAAARRPVQQALSAP